MNPTSRHQDLGLPPAGLDGRLSSRPGAAAWKPLLRSCLALLAACGWLFSEGILGAAEPTDGSPVTRVFEESRGLLMAESVNAESNVLRFPKGSDPES